MLFYFGDEDYRYGRADGSYEVFDDDSYGGADDSYGADDDDEDLDSTEDN